MKFRSIRNNQSISLAGIPDLQADEARSEALKMVNSGMRPVVMFGAGEGGGTRVFIVLGDDSNSIMHVASFFSERGSKGYVPFFTDSPVFEIFEREIHEEFQILQGGSALLKGIRYPHLESGRNMRMEDHPFTQFEGSEIHQVAVGPVHAGVIEPGHFRFSCLGERILNLEIQLGYQHRGVERMFSEGDLLGKMSLAESIAGDTVIGHGLAYVQLMEAASGYEAGSRCSNDRAVALEMERIAVHVGDIGAIGNDIAYMMASAVAGANRTYAINAMLSVCGSRFGRGFLDIGSNNASFSGDSSKTVLESLRKIRSNMEMLCEEMFDSSGVLSRLENTGKVKKEDVIRCGFTGLTARASGVKRDIRSDYPFGAYRQHPIYPLSLESGDVFARAFMRYLEMQQSMNFIDDILNAQEASGPNQKRRNPSLQDDIFAISLVEGWRGEIVHALVRRKNERVRYKIKDPSFNNWTALELAVRGNSISDFPLCNKSFNLSYAGNDL